MQEPPFDDTVQLSDMKVDFSDEAPVVENGQGFLEDPPDVELTTGEVNHISTRRGYAIVGILFFVNLLNYMDRFTIAGKITVQGGGERSGSLVEDRRALDLRPKGCGFQHHVTAWCP